MERIKKFLKNNWSFILTIVLALIVRQTRILGINIVEGVSMLPTLHNGQVVIGSSIKTLDRGDIVVAKTDKLVIKRIVGLPGENIKYTEGTLYINGKAYNEDYIEKGRDTRSKTQSWEFNLGEDEYLIAGDNRDDSYDGRYYGPLPKKSILEKIYIRFK